jgi:hypothetical protein
VDTLRTLLEEDRRTFSARVQRWMSALHVDRAAPRVDEAESAASVLLLAAQGEHAALKVLEQFDRLAKRWTERSETKRAPSFAGFGMRVARLLAPVWQLPVMQRRAADQPWALSRDFRRLSRWLAAEVE